MPELRALSSPYTTGASIASSGGCLAAAWAAQVTARPFWRLRAAMLARLPVPETTAVMGAGSTRRSLISGFVRSSGGY